MKTVLMPQAVSCENCKWGVQIPVGAVVPDVITLEEFAKEMHKQNGKLCLLPILSIPYVQVLVDDSVFDGMVKRHQEKIANASK